MHLETIPVLYHQSWDLQSVEIKDAFSIFRKCHAAEVPHKGQFVCSEYNEVSQSDHSEDHATSNFHQNSIGILSTLYMWNSRKRIQVNNSVEASMIFEIVTWCLICAIQACGSEQPKAYVSEVKCTDKTNCWFMHFNEATVSIWFQFEMERKWQKCWFWIGRPVLFCFFKVTPMTLGRHQDMKRLMI